SSSQTLNLELTLGINFLFGTIIIGSIGAIMDVALSIASSMWEIWEINPEISAKKIIQSGMNIGRDIMGSMSNTLILAYVGTSIHLIILFMVYNITLVEILNYDSVSSEVLRAMAGSIGLMFTIPATVWISAAFYLKKKSK
ncbi:MAG: YibE/F family protein, partial [Eubacteriales bacterium]|nr:YibE/F family protein [Eubacteriales bacterium]